MVFNSSVFLIFFLIYFLFHIIMPGQYRPALIILGGTIFYGYWNPFYVWLPHLLILLTYIGSFWIEAGGENRFYRLIFIICTLLFPLIIIKYSHFIYNDAISVALGLNPKELKYTLPLGVSFITFTVIAYVIDVYRKHFKIERNISKMAALVLFFPHLIAGPILRPGDLLPRLYQSRPVTKALQVRLVIGISIFTIGLLKKMVFADSIAEVVDPIYNSSDGLGLSSWDYLLAIYGFSLQLYCDFSGYTDMAMGLAILLGVQLPNNFLQPYTSLSIIEFWRRWHITLSSWLRDYLYYPLGGNLQGYARQGINILITMILGGLWHGASWTFALWGLMHGLGITLVHGLRKIGLTPWIAKIPKPILIFTTFHFVTLTWIFFRASDMETAIRVLNGPLTSSFENFLEFIQHHLFSVILILLFLVTHRWDSHKTIRVFVKKLPPSALWVILGFIWFISITFNLTSTDKFIYYDF